MFKDLWSNEHILSGSRQLHRKGITLLFLALLWSREQPRSPGCLQLLSGCCFHRGAWALGCVGSAVGHTGLAVCSLWDLPNHRLSLCPLHWQADSQSLGWGKSKEHHFYPLPESGEGNDIPLLYSCLENPMDGGAWWTAVHGVAKSRTQLSDFAFTLHFHALEKEMAAHSSVLAWRIPGTGEPGGLPSMGSCRVGHDWSDSAAAAAATAWVRGCLRAKERTPFWNDPSENVSTGSE